MALAALNYELQQFEPAVGVASLRGWLHGNWGLLFSHPDDFASYGFEADRWLVHVEHALDASAVRPLALTFGAADAPRTWIEELGGATLALRDADVQRVSSLRERERSLVRAIVAATERFVMLIDESLQLRRTLLYSPGDRLPSPMELATMAARMRNARLHGAIEASSCARAGSLRVFEVIRTLEGRALRAT